MTGPSYEILVSILTIFATILGIWITKEINEKYYQSLQSQAWGFLIFDPATLEKIYSHNMECITKGKAKAKHYKTIEAINMAIEMQNRLRNNKNQID